LKKYTILFVIASLFIAVGYASISDVDLSIDGLVSAFADKKVVITNVELVSNSDASLDDSSINDYVKTTLNGKVTLGSSETSSIKYKVTVKNNDDEVYTYKKTKYDTTCSECYDNENIVYTIEGLTEEETTIDAGDTLEFYITFSYKDNTVPDTKTLNYILNFKFTNYKSLMEEKIIESFGEDNVTTYNLDNMSYTDLKNEFGSTITDTYTSDNPIKAGIYKTEDSNGSDVYFYRGNVDNNYVYFAGYYWQIISIDEDGNLRIILAKSANDETYTYQDTSVADSLEEAQNLLNYNNSKVKTVVDEWYNTNIASNTEYSSKIISSTFCNDLTPTKSVSSGNGSDIYYFGSYIKIGTDGNNFKPSLSCPTDYTISSNAGLLSVEEYVLAGGAQEKWLWGMNYLNNYVSDYWTMSPSYYDIGVKTLSAFFIKQGMVLVDYDATTDDDGNKVYNLLDYARSVRPVITITGEEEMLGTGTLKDPYRYENIYPIAQPSPFTDFTWFDWSQRYYVNEKYGAILTINATDDGKGLKAAKGMISKDDFILFSDEESISMFRLFSSTKISEDDDSIVYTLNMDETYHGTWGYYLNVDKSEDEDKNENYFIKISGSSQTLRYELIDNGKYVYISNTDETVYLCYDEATNSFTGKSTKDDACKLRIFNTIS